MGKIREGFDGKVAWASNPAQGITEKSGAELARARREAIFNRELHFQKQFEKLEVKGSTELPEGTAWILEATPKGGKAERYYFSGKTGLLVRQDASADAPEGSVDMEMHIEDYREVDGIKLAHTLRVVQPAATAFILRFTEIKHNVPIEDSQFVKPSN
jgi:hypothetical protein